MKKQEKNTQNVELFLNRLKSAFNFTQNNELAAFLDVKPQVLSNWKERKSINYEVILTKCVSKGINLHWLFTGEGDMLTGPAAASEQAQAAPQCASCQYIKDIARYKEDIARYCQEIEYLNQQLTGCRNQEQAQPKRNCA